MKDESETESRMPPAVCSGNPAQRSRARDCPQCGFGSSTSASYRAERAAQPGPSSAGPIRLLRAGQVDH